MAETHQRIVVKAAELFRRRGYAAVSMRDIGDAVGLSKAGLYHYCPSKDGLLQDIVRLANQLLLDQLEEVRKLDAPPIDRLRALVRTRMEVLTRYQDVMTVIWQERPLIGMDRFSESVRMAESYREGVGDLINQAQRAGALRRDVDPRILMLALDGMTGWALFWFHADGRVDPGTIGEQFWSFVFNGVANPDR